MKLFEPGKIGTMAMKNRIIMAPMRIGTIVELDGRIARNGIDYFTARAKGGAGMVMIGLVRIERKIENIPQVYWHDLMTDSRQYIPRLGELADALHDYGCKLGIQLSAGWGRNAYVHFHPDIGARSPSNTPSFRDPKVMATELSTQEVEELVRDFQFAAEICRSAGVDCIEMHGHDGYLFDAFSDELWNQRTDKYGGSFEKRLTFAYEAMDAVRRGAGKDYPVLYRLALMRDVDGGRGAEEGLEICRRLEKSGVAALDIDVGTYEVRYWAIPPTTQPPGCLVPFAEMAKKVVKVPIIVAGKLGYPALAESVLQQGKADYIAMGRGLIADPEWPNKVKEGRWEDIRPCIGDNEGCIGRASKSKYVSCSVNPTACVERELALTPAEKVKSVLVVGGGPAGLEAARVAAQRGHKVSLWEKTDSLGGNLRPAAAPAFKKDYQRLIDYLSLQVKKAGVDIQTNKEATPAKIQRAKPDVVFIATGGTQVIPPIPGVNNACVANGIDVLMGRQETGQKVVVIGGGLIGSEVALFVAQQGKAVTVVEVLDKVMGDMFMCNRQHMLKLMADAKVVTMTSTWVKEIGNKTVTIEKDGKVASLDADTVIVAVGMKANNALVDAVYGKVPEVINIGDSVTPRRVLDAIWEGYRKARVI